jgi:GTP-binding protein HflX
MSELHIQTTDRERALLVGVGIKGSRPLLSVQESLAELARLADTAGLEVVGQTTQTLAQIDPATFIGSGKVDEIRQMITAAGIQTVIFDDELSPRHQRELETLLGEGVKVLDRSALILDIFAQHARTHEGALQVELAQYEYRLPRLTRAWTHLARQGGGAAGRGGTGGVGLRGPGETQLEVDRRDIRNRISRLKKELEEVRHHRSRHRAQRERTGIPLVALVGYTNAGKSTLLHALTGADIYIADQLFATLDPTTRRVELPSGRQALFTDTVGFIQKLPTTLVAAFRATLEEINEADLLLIVADASHPQALQQIEAVEDALAEIDVPPVPRILVWNKIDLMPQDWQPPSLPSNTHYAAQAAISAQTSTGLVKLLETVESTLAQTLYHLDVLIPYERGDLVSLLHQQGTVFQVQHTENGVRISVQLPAALYERFKSFRLPKP